MTLSVRCSPDEDTLMLKMPFSLSKWENAVSFTYPLTYKSIFLRAVLKQSLRQNTDTQTLESILSRTHEDPCSSAWGPWLPKHTHTHTCVCVGESKVCWVPSGDTWPVNTHLSSVAVKHPKYGRVTLVDDVREHIEPVLHVVSPALDGVHGHVVALELPCLGELRVQDVQPAEPLVLHHLRHFPLDHLDRIPARLDDGLHFVRVEEVTPQSQADAQQEQGLRSEQKITHDPT